VAQHDALKVPITLGMRKSAMYQSGASGEFPLPMFFISCSVMLHLSVWRSQSSS